MTSSEYKDKTSPEMGGGLPPDYQKHLDEYQEDLKSDKEYEEWLDGLKSAEAPF